jgi:hypothetical protein
MSTKEDRKEIYIECRKQTGLNDIQWAKIMNLGFRGGEREVHKKERDSDKPSSRGVSMPEALAAQLLKFLDEEGYNLLDIGFTEDGRLDGAPSRRTRRS